MSSRKLLAILLLNAPSYVCIVMFQALQATNNEALGWLFFAALVPGALFWLGAFGLCAWETLQYVRRVRGGSTEPIARPLGAWLMTLPMAWIIMNFAAG